MDKEKKQVTNTLITQFYLDFTNLKAYFANYQNLIVETEFKGDPKDFEKKTSDEEKKQILSFIQYVKYYITQTYLTYAGLKDELKEFQTDFQKLENNYNKIIQSKVPERKDIQEYTITLSKAFVKGIIAENLAKSYEISSDDP